MIFCLIHNLHWYWILRSMGTNLQLPIVFPLKFGLLIQHSFLDVLFHLTLYLLSKSYYHQLVSYFLQFSLLLRAFLQWLLPIISLSYFQFSSLGLLFQYQFYLFKPTPASFACLFLHCQHFLLPFLGLFAKVWWWHLYPCFPLSSSKALPLKVLAVKPNQLIVNHAFLMIIVSQLKEFHFGFGSTSFAVIFVL